MRILAIAVCLAATSMAQNLAEFGAVATGSAIGGAGGKPISNGIDAVFGKADRETAKAADKKPTTKESPAVLRTEAKVSHVDTGGVPLPPLEPSRRSAARSLPVAQFIVPEEALRVFSLADVAPALPPPPVMSPQDFQTIAPGMARAEVLKLGAPSSKITMTDDGHVVESYSYSQNGRRFGTLRLTDGAVSRVD